MMDTQYFEVRMSQLGIIQEENQVEINAYDPESQKNIRKPVPVFTASKRQPGIDILLFTLDRDTIRVNKHGSNQKQNYVLTRVETPIVRKDGSEMKYILPKGQGTYPFFHPSLIEAFEKKTEVPVLFLTEGFFKAWKATMHGMPTIGLSSITHLGDAEDSKRLHKDIIRFVHDCKVKRVVWLTDGDCRDISVKALTETKDLYKRPHGFFLSVEKFKQYFEDHVADKYFFHVNSDEIVQKYRDKGINRGDVKGIDDVMIALPEFVEEIVKDSQLAAGASVWFCKMNLIRGSRHTQQYFQIDSPLHFYQFHAERQKEIVGKQFVFNGTRYSYDEAKNEVKIEVPADAKKYFRVGDQYFEFVDVPNKYGQIERRFLGRQKSTITDDHGKNFIRHINKFNAFCCVPDNINFQQVIHNCFNIYTAFEWEPESEACTEEECPTILNFVKHIFGFNKQTFKHPSKKDKDGKTLKLEYDNWQLGLDYIQLLLQKPTEKLPILCLVSRANNTGKSTFGKFLKMLFTSNVAIVGNQDLAGDFNAHWATKLLVVCDETKIDKQHVIEKVKNLSTADKIMMNAKGKDHIELDCFIKFMFITNNEESFINISEDDIRYWVNKVPTITIEVTDILEKMQAEIPAFLSFLGQRRLLTEKLNRMWFHPTLIKTEALKKVIVNSQPTIIKELRQGLKDMFLDFGVDRILMTPTDIKEDILKNKRYEGNYLERVLKDDLKVQTVKEYYVEGDRFKSELENDVIHWVKTNMGIDSDLQALQHVKAKSKVIRYDYPVWVSKVEPGQPEQAVRVDKKKTGRPYVFYRADFVAESEEVEALAEDQYINSQSPEPIRPAAMTQAPIFPNGGPDEVNF